MEGHSLLVKFDRDDPEFVRGWELGMVWRALTDDPGPHGATLHIDNAEMVLRIADFHRRTVVSVEGDETWMSVEFSERHA